MTGWFLVVYVMFLLLCWGKSIHEALTFGAIFLAVFSVGMIATSVFCHVLGAAK